MTESKLIEKLEEYAEKHDLSEEEKEEIGRKLVGDKLIFGTCFLHMEKGRIDPSEASVEGDYYAI